jgi:hypothetical protein
VVHAQQLQQQGLQRQQQLLEVQRQGLELQACEAQLGSEGAANKVRLQARSSWELWVCHLGNSTLCAQLAGSEFMHV